MELEMSGVSSEDQSVMRAIHKKLNPQSPQLEKPQVQAPEVKPQPPSAPMDVDLQPVEAVTDVQPEVDQPAEGQIAEEATEPVVEVPTLKVTIKDDEGKDVEQELPVDEVRSGYMRHADYTRKTQALAKERAAIPQRLAESERAVTEARQGFTQALQNLEAFVTHAAAPELNGVNWNRLAQENPSEYVRLNQRAQDINATLTQIRNYQQQVSKQTAEQQKKALQDQAVAARETLNREIPGGWNDALYSKIQKGASTHYGYLPEEIGNWVDARAMIVMNDALKYRELISGKPIAQQKVEKAPLAVKPGAAQTPADKRQSVVDKARDTARKSGSVEDAMALMQAKRARR